MATKNKSKLQEHMVPMACGECKRKNYWTRKNKKRFDSNPSERTKLELQKYCSWCKKKTPHKESKK